MTEAKLELIAWVKKFAWRRRPEPNQYILDGFGGSFYIRFDFDDCDDRPTSLDTCDILVERVTDDDPVAGAICLVNDANKHGIMRFLSALGISQFGDEVKAAYYEMSNPLREESTIPPGPGGKGGTA